ncbi:MAG TPA: hypothetical protein P5279_05075 [Anaerohalosphaeraceae bacterium]|jgi:hypothetical protein|nr:hypothetical protein [Anaerohalosphaeraceae bacterium]HRT49842.1 hypothetical protein [Anaerohalosphaeraceae bacterium]HRT87061.1 hypothetical protein [Anaerohalosphaeraceae bacterium]
MVIVSFICGLAFFTLGLAAALCPRKGSAFRLADHLGLLAAFGLLHALGEWLNVFSQIGPLAGAQVLVLARAFVLPVSFICLVQFAARMIPASRSNFVWLRFATPVLWALWLTAFLAGPRNLLMWNIWSRYLLCLPAGLLAAWALSLQKAEAAVVSRSVAAGLRIAAVSFVLYAFLNGLIVDKASFFPASMLNTAGLADAAGIPVEVFTAACALAMTCGVIRTLAVFQWEIHDRVRTLQAECTRYEAACRQHEADMTRMRQVAAFGEMSEEMARRVEEPLGLAKIFLQRLLLGLNRQAAPETLRTHARESLDQINAADATLQQFRAAAGLRPAVQPTAQPGRPSPDDGVDDLPNPDSPRLV